MLLQKLRKHNEAAEWQELLAAEAAKKEQEQQAEARLEAAISEEAHIQREINALQSQKKLSLKGVRTMVSYQEKLQKIREGFEA